MSVQIPASDQAFEQHRKDFFRTAFEQSTQGHILYTGWKHRALDGLPELMTELRYQAHHSSGDPKHIMAILKRMAATACKNYCALIVTLQAPTSSTDCGQASGPISQSTDTAVQR